MADWRGALAPLAFGVASDALAGLYVVGGLVTAAYAVRIAVHTWLFARQRGQPCEPARSASTSPPMVTVQLPIFNELAVAARAIDAACRLRWPAGHIEIQVLDDSDDETRQIVDASVAAWAARGIDIRVVRRRSRAGFKAGALQAGLRRAEGDALAIFDADFVPPPDFLERTVPFLADGVAAVQARWTHLNAGDGALTRIQALALDSYFVVEQSARARAGLALNFNGSAGVWRREAIEAAGGWRGDTVTEDVDLSYRAQLAGWRIVFLPEVTAPAELPATCLAFKRQQRRWARGTVQCAMRLAAPIWHSGWSPAKRVHALASLSNHVVQPILLLMLLGLPALLVLHPNIHPLVGLLSITALNVPGQHALAQHALLGHPAWIRKMAMIPLLASIGVGMSLNGTLAVIGAFRAGGEFHRTPKRGGGAAAAEAATGPGLAASRVPDDAPVLAPEDGRSEAAYRLSLDGQSIAESILAFYSLAVLVAAIASGAWGLVPLASTASVGYAWIATASLGEGLGWNDATARVPRALRRVASR